MQLIANIPILKETMLHAWNKEEFKFLQDFLQDYGKENLQSAPLRKGYCKMFPKTQAASQEDAGEGLPRLCETVQTGNPLVSIHSDVNPEEAFIQTLVLSEEHLENLKGLATHETLLPELFQKNILRGRGVDSSKGIESPKFQRPPDQLLFILGRYDTSRTKLNEDMFIPSVFSLDKNHIQNQQEDISYHCDGFIKHLGWSLSGGHYVCYLKIGSKYFCCNDNTVEEINRDKFEENMKQGYIYHYSK
jgi:hypothetical protein